MGKQTVGRHKIVLAVGTLSGDELSWEVTSSPSLEAFKQRPGSLPIEKLDEVT